MYIAIAILYDLPYTYLIARGFAVTLLRNPASVLPLCVSVVRSGAEGSPRVKTPMLMGSGRKGASMSTIGAYRSCQNRCDRSSRIIRAIHRGGSTCCQLLLLHIFCSS